MADESSTFFTPVELHKVNKYILCESLKVCSSTITVLTVIDGSVVLLMTPAHFFSVLSSQLHFSKEKENFASDCSTEQFKKTKRNSRHRFRKWRCRRTVPRSEGLMAVAETVRGFEVSRNVYVRFIRVYRFAANNICLVHSASVIRSLDCSCCCAIGFSAVAVTGRVPLRSSPEAAENKRGT